MFKRRRIKIACLLSILLFGSLLYFLPSRASEVANSQEVSSVIHNSLLQNTGSTITRDSQLTDTEWNRYLQFMQGMDGRWYPQLSAAAVLGLHAGTEIEREHFADLVAQEEHDKIAREMIFNHAVYLAVRRLFPTEPIIQSSDKTPFNPQKNRGSHP